ncbi:hypothetical protein [Hymenobacter jejuensis]|uniref:Uncharacterized protein n=1 Tax=Hymenobacter jejuensis TaxID=2502781 RepID=A0A5B7ZW71_9BACT|nr:hypothetical protein [Hymenobacter jejuensis]QDA59218.1 hypothetical protein FHG12_03445 [Hymenobacter jejuensis]
MPVYYFVATLTGMWCLSTFGRYALHNNIFVFHLTTAAEVPLLGLAYYRLVPLPKVRVGIVIGVVLFGIVALLDATVLNGWMKHQNVYARSAATLVLLSLAFVHLDYLSSQPAEQLSNSRPALLLSIAVLVLYSALAAIHLAVYIEYKNPAFSYEEHARLDNLFNLPFPFIYGISMGLLTRLFAYFPLNKPPRQALPKWLRFGRFRPKAPITAEVAAAQA